MLKMIPLMTFLLLVMRVKQAIGLSKSKEMLRVALMEAGSLRSSKKMMALMETLKALMRTSIPMMTLKEVPMTLKLTGNLK